MVDNTTALAYINERGGTKKEVNDLAHELWLWLLERNIVLDSMHVPGVKNVKADEALRQMYNTDCEWMLHTSIFDFISNTHSPFVMDLFASGLNKQMMPYVSWGPNPGAKYIDALRFPWEKGIYYGFPPFSLIGQILQKLAREGGELVLVAPL